MKKKIPSRARQTRTTPPPQAAWRVLDALYVLARADQTATRTRVADQAKLLISDVDAGLSKLETKGLADADACRLTMVGFAMMHAYRAKKDPRVLTLAA